MRNYILLGHEAYPTDDIEVWGRFFETMDRRVAYDRIKDKHGKWKIVSTVFVGIDHGRGGPNPPLLFETMVFPDTSYSEEYTRRYSTWEQAEWGHKLVVRAVKEGRMGKLKA